MVSVPTAVVTVMAGGAAHEPDTVTGEALVSVTVVVALSQPVGTVTIVVLSLPAPVTVMYEVDVSP